MTDTKHKTATSTAAQTQSAIDHENADNEQRPDPLTPEALTEQGITVSSSSPATEPEQIALTLTPGPTKQDCRSSMGFCDRIRESALTLKQDLLAGHADTAKHLLSKVRRDIAHIEEQLGFIAPKED